MNSDYINNTQLLKEPLSFAELLDTGAHFEVDTGNYNDIDVFEDFNVDDDETEHVNDEDLLSPWKRSFKELRELMTPINEYIYKRITRAGVEEKGLVPAKARVSLRYSAYWEGESAPFDSSMLRGTQFEFETDQNMVLEGLEAAVRSMYAFEQADFIISYKLLFHELGCPPRIKPRADGLFRIEVLNFTLIGDEKSLESIAPEDRSKFAVVFPKVQDMHLHGKDCFKRGSYHSAISAFENAIASLNYCRLADESDELKQIELLITLYTNVLVCYNKLNKSSKACIAMKALRHITKNKPSCKALFQEGRALAALGEYQRARDVFVQAQAMQPNNKEISDEIINMEQRVSKYVQSMKEIWSRALVGKQKVEVEQKETPQETSLQNQLKRDFQLELMEFEKSSLQSINMNRKMYTEKEFDVLRLLAAQFKMKLSLSPLDVDQLTLSKLHITDN